MIFLLKIFIFNSPMFDCSKFLNRMGWTQRDLSAKLECSQSAIAMWSSCKTSPPYSAIEKLIHLGATAQELFGEELAAKLEANSYEINEPVLSIPQEQINEGVRKALAELIGKKV